MTYTSHMLHQTLYICFWHQCAHRSPYGLVWLHWYHQKDYFIIYPGGNVTWSSYGLSNQRGEILTTKSLRWPQIRPGRHILRLCRPIVPIWVIQTHIDTIGSIDNSYHTLSWRWYDFSCQLFLTISPNNEERYTNNWAGIISFARIGILRCFRRSHVLRWVHSNSFCT